VGDLSEPVRTYLSAEPVIFREVLDDLVRPAQAQGLLRCLIRHRPVEAAMEGDLVKAVIFEDLQTGGSLTIMAHYILDATEEGDLLPVTGCESVVGAESAAIIGEPHALDGPAIRWISRRSPGVWLWSGGRAKITKLTGQKRTSSGAVIGPISGRDLNWDGQPRNPRLACL
jgi:hypothetical protein